MNFYEYVAQDAECKAPIDKCRAKGGPSECRWHRYFSTYGIDAVDGLNIDELSKDRIRFIFKESSGETRSKTENTVRGVISDLEKLCPSFKMPEFNLICADTTVLSVPAISELDTQRTPEPFLCIGKFETSSNQGYSYFHEGERGVRDVIRHEIGHILTTRRVSGEFSKFEHEIIAINGREKYLRFIARNISEYAADGNEAERLAEIFSAVTDANNSNTKIPNEFRVFVIKNMMTNGAEMSVQNSDAIAKDEEDGSYYVPAVIIENFSRPPKEGFIWDCEYGDWVSKDEYRNRKRLGEWVKIGDESKESVRKWIEENDPGLKNISRAIQEFS